VTAGDRQGLPSCARRTTMDPDAVSPVLRSDPDRLGT
jgi:hypothetical protein